MSDPVVYANFVSENAVANGIGSFALQGPSEEYFFSYAQKIAVGSLVGYVARQGNATEEGIGLLQSETILTRLYIIDSSATGISNNVDPGTPVQISFDPTVQVQVWSAVPARLFISTDVDGNPVDPSPFRNALFVQSITEMKAEEGLLDQEHVFVSGNGLFKFDAADSTLPDNVDTFRPDNYPTALFKRVRLDIQNAFKGSATIDAAATGTGAIQRLYANPLAGTPNDYVQQSVDTTNSAWDFSSRFNQSGGLKKFLTLFTPGNNADRALFRVPFVLHDRANLQGVKDKSVLFDTTASEIAVAIADAASDSTAADSMIIPRVKGTYLLGAYETIADLKAIDAAKYAKTNQRALVLGSADGGDIPPFYVEWFPSSSATADDAVTFRPAVGAAASGNGRWVRVAAAIDVTFTSGDATPSVKNGSWFVTAGTTAITDFTGEYEGQVIVIQRGSSDIAITHDATKIDLGGSNITLTTTCPRIVLQSQGGVWRLRSIGGHDSKKIDVYSSSNKLFTWGTNTGNAADGVSDGQAYFFQRQSTYVLNGSLGCGYFQRIADYTGGAASIGAAEVNPAVRGFTYIGSNVTYAVETGVLGYADNNAYEAQAVGVAGTGVSQHGGAVWGGVLEAIEQPERFTATSGQTSFTIENGYTAGKCTVYRIRGGTTTLLARTTDFTDANGTTVTLTSGATAGDIIVVHRGDPKRGMVGAEIDGTVGYGTDNDNAASGNRQALAVVGRRSDTAVNAMAHLGCMINLFSSPGDSYFKADRGINFLGQYGVGIDMSAMTNTGHFLRLPNDAGITPNGNFAAGNQGYFDTAGYAALMLGHSSNGGFIKIGDGTHWARIQNSTSSGFVIGTDTGIDFFFTRNGAVKLRGKSDGVQLTLSASASADDNSSMIFELTSSTTLTVKVKLADGTNKSGTISLL